MSRLATRAELIKLAHTLGRDEASLAFLRDVPAEDLRRFRGALDELLFSQELTLLHRAVALSHWLPNWLLVLLCRWVLGPLLTARLAGEMPARRAVQIIVHLPPDFVARAAAMVDPRRVRELMQQMPVESVVRVARSLLQQRDYLTLGRIVEFLPDEAIRAVEATIEDEGALLRIAFFTESRNRMDHLVHLMPPEKVRDAILVVQDDARRELWPLVFALLANVSYELKRELGEVAAAQGQNVLNALVHAIQEEDLWVDVLPMVVSLAPDTQRRLANMPVLSEPGVLEGFVRAASESGLWNEVLSLLRLMNEELRIRVSRIADRLPVGALRPAAYAALKGEHWEALLDLVGRNSDEQQRELVELIDGYGEIDARLQARLTRRAGVHGFGAWFAPPAVALATGA
ncbi:MAG: hypothetical protein ACT4QA_23385 [Panacagrimonas sp.]